MSVTTEPTDPELLDRMSSGDREALAIIFRRHHGTVYRFSRQMLGSKEAAEDVTQDVFVALAKSAGRFNPAVASLVDLSVRYCAKPGAAALQAKPRAARGQHRRDCRGREAAFATSSDPADVLSLAQATRQLRLAILRLPVHYREVVVLCELNGLSYEDAAAIAGCPVGTVRSRLSRARQILIERCRTMLAPDRAEGRGQRAEQAREQEKRWLIPTKNNC